MEALSRILSSQAFSKSARLSEFLRYVCITALDGQVKILCEQHIGIAVFGRPAHYNPAEDTIVRSTARLLRQRLALYYENEGQQDQFRITVPRGAYVPVFVPLAATDAATEATTPDKLARANAPSEIPLQEITAAPITAPASATPSQRRVKPLTLALTLLAMLLLLALTAWALLQTRVSTAQAAAPGNRFWASMLPADRDTLMVVADSGLVMYQHDNRQQVGLEDYIANRLGDTTVPGATQSAAHYRMRRYTAMSSVTLAAEIAKLATAAPERFHVRFARDLQLGDLKHANSILVGVEQSNPWWELFRNQFNFHIDWDPVSDKFLISNDHPIAGEAPAYEFSKDDPHKHGYALIGYMRNLSGDGHTLLIGGTTSAGTDAAMEFLLRPAHMAPLLQQASRPDGSLAEFEVLIQFVLQANGNTDIHVIGTRIKPPRPA